MLLATHAQCRDAIDAADICALPQRVQALVGEIAKVQLKDRQWAAERAHLLDVRIGEGLAPDGDARYPRVNACVSPTHSELRVPLTVIRG